MKIPALPMASPLASRLLREGADLVTDVACDAVVFVDKAHIGHHGPDQNFRPYLKLSGEMRSLKPESRLPGDVDEVFARPTLGPTFDLFYEFDHDQLTNLVAKGYFEKDFAVPEIVTGVVYELPVNANLLILHPQDREAGDVPLVFVDVVDKNDMALDLESTGYDLEDYFKSALTVERSGTDPEHDAEMARNTGPDYVDDIFNDPRFEALRRREAEHEIAMQAERDKMRQAYQDSADQAEQEHTGAEDQAENSGAERADHAGQGSGDHGFDEDVSVDEAAVSSATSGTAELSLDELYSRIVVPYIEGRTESLDDRAEREGESLVGEGELDLAGSDQQDRSADQHSQPAEDERAESSGSDRGDQADDNDELVFDSASEDDELGAAPISLGDTESPSPQRSLRHQVRVAQDAEQDSVDRGGRGDHGLGG